MNTEIAKEKLVGEKSGQGHRKNQKPKPKRVIINHGEISKSLDLSSALYKLNRMETNVPRNLETLRLR